MRADLTVRIVRDLNDLVLRDGMLQFPRIIIPPNSAVAPQITLSPHLRGLNGRRQIEFS